MTLEELKVKINNEVRLRTEESSIPQTTVADIMDELANTLISIQSSLEFSTGTIDIWTSGQTYNNKQLVRRNNLIFEAQADGTVSDPFLDDSSGWREIGDVTREMIRVNVGSGKIGGFKNDDIINPSTPLHAIVNKLLIEYRNALYSLPTITLTSTQTPVGLEVGELINVPLLLNFIQNDSGGITSASIKKNGVSISGSLSTTDSNIVVTETQTNYQGTISYAQGPIKNDSTETPDPTGRVNAGTINTNVLTYKGVRKGFFGLNGTQPDTSAEVRALTSFLDPKEGSQFTIEVPQGTTSLHFAYPASIRDIDSALYVELHQETRENFIENKQVVLVGGANSYSPILYKVFSYTPVEPFPIAVTYKITI